MRTGARKAICNMAKDTANRQSAENSIEAAPNDAILFPKRYWFMTRPVVALTGLCVRRPIPILSCALVLAVASLFLAFCYLNASPANFQQTLSPGSLAAKLKDEYLGEVANPIEACFVVEQRGSSTTKKDIESALSSICFEILGRPEFFRVIATGLDEDSFKSNRLFFYSAEEYEEATELALTAQAIKRSEWSQFAPDEVARRLTKHIGDDLASDVRAPLTINSVVTFAQALADITETSAISPESTPSPVVSGIETNVPRALAPDPYYLFHTKTAQGGGVMFTFVDSLTQDERRRAVEAINLIVQKTQATHPRTIIEATGLPFIERREFDASIHALKALVVFFFASVTVFFWAFFGRASRAFIALSSLLVGFCWLLGFQTLESRSLTPDNFHEWFVVMCVAIASVASYLAKYVIQRRKDRSVSEALMTTAKTTGASLASLAVVASVGSLIFGGLSVVCRTFFVMCGAGIALSVLATLIVTPILVKMIDGARPFRADGIVANLEGEQDHTNPYLRTIAVMGLIVAATLTLGLTRIHHDPTRATFHGLGFENLRAQEAASQYLESRALYGVMFADSVDDARQIVAKLNESQGDDPFFYVESVSDNLPIVDADGILRVEAIHNALESLKPEFKQIPRPTRKKLVSELETLRLAARGAFTTDGGSLAVEEYLTRAIEQIEGLSEQEFEKRIDAFSQLLALGTLERLYALRDCSEPRAPTLDDLSNALKTRYLGQKTGRVILRVYSLRTLSDSSNLVNFVRFLREIAPNATGPAVLSYEQGLQTSRWISVYLIALTFLFMIVSYVRFKTWRACIAILLAPLVALLETGGVAGLLGVAINPVNWCIALAVFFLSLHAALRFSEDYEEDPDRFFSRENALATCVAASTIGGLYAFGLACQESGWQNLSRIGILSSAIYAATATILLPALLNWSAIQAQDEEMVVATESEKE